MTGNDTDPSDAEHERALMRVFEMRHPMLALAIRLILRRPLSGTFVAIIFIAVSTIAYEGIGVIDKRFSTWLDVNYVADWQAHDRTVALEKAADQNEADAKAHAVHEGVAITLPPGRSIVVHYAADLGATEPWREIPYDSGDHDDLSLYIKESAGHFVTLPPGDQIAPLRMSNGDPAQIEIGGKPYVLVHSMWWSEATPWHQEFPADFRNHETICGSRADAGNCTIYGHIARSDFDALLAHANDTRNAATVSETPPTDPPSIPFVRMTAPQYGEFVYSLKTGFMPQDLKDIASALAGTDCEHIDAGTRFVPALTDKSDPRSIMRIADGKGHVGLLVTITDDGPNYRAYGLIPMNRFKLPHG